MAAGNKKVGIFFGTSTGNTENAAYTIASELGDIADGPFEIDEFAGSVAKKFDEYDALIVGTPTWNTGADSERSGTGWDEMYYGEMQELKIQGRHVAVFGQGDSVSYGENYADATGELHDVFEDLGCKMYGYISQDGYLHEASKSIRGDKFCGLLLDDVNQDDLTEDRIKSWVTQLHDEGFLMSTGASTATPEVTSEPSTTASTDVSAMDAELAALAEENARLREMLDKSSRLLEETIVESTGKDESGFVPHLNPKTGRTIWTSPNGKSCYFTSSSLFP
eukprot:CAMPEP_0178950596 /NCGR_PEP_ID=MMETSP0789-20121207/6744_1 /TAXON_ID=3005 /ORGANISM="Rhizosolenia setigera, Strain CCMP 1694" /LENGTH=278 /DNA_ID=CAMNT_0020631347 /DNA_START=88 /DNA_END=924 /DNA_ORIENTATION=+